MHTARSIWRCFEEYKVENPVWTVATFSTLYATLQAFAIPGPMILSIVSGALWGTWTGQGIVLLCSCIGSASCYLLSATLAKPLVERAVPTRLAQLRSQLAEHERSSGRWGMFFFALFLRLTPLVPNWFVNVSAPIVGLPFAIFMPATLVGLVPANYVHCSTGTLLAELAGVKDSSSLGDSDSAGQLPPQQSWTPYIALFMLQFVALLPLLCKSRLAKLMPSASAAVDSASSQHAAPAAVGQGGGAHKRGAHASRAGVSGSR